MALLFCDSFDHYNDQSFFHRKWTSGNMNINAAGSGGGRTGAWATVYGAGMFKTLPDPAGYASLAVGMGYNIGGTVFLYPGAPIIFIAVNGNDKIGFQFQGDGRMYVQINFGGVVQNSPPTNPFIVDLATWYSFELQATISSGSLTYTARINEATVLSGTFTDSHIGGTWNQVQFGGAGGGVGSWADDIYVTDGELLGDVRLYCLFPNADGSLSQWVPSVPGSHYANVNEHSPDDLSSYVSCSSSALGNEDDYYLDAITGFVGTIKGAQALWCVSKSDAGAAAVEGIWKSGGSAVTTPAVNPSYTSWFYFLSPQRKSLFTGSDWTVAEINALQLGIQRTF